MLFDECTRCAKKKLVAYGTRALAADATCGGGGGDDCGSRAVSRETQTVRCACRLVLARDRRARRPALWGGAPASAAWWGPVGPYGGGTARQGARPERTNDGAGGGPTVRNADSRAPFTLRRRAVRGSPATPTFRSFYFFFSFSVSGPHSSVLFALTTLQLLPPSLTRRRKFGRTVCVSFSS